MTAMTASPVDATIAVVRRSLPGPRRARAELLREVRDGLEDAVGAYRDAGFGQDEAQRRAVADFGDPHVLAAELRDELAATYGRRTAAKMGIAYLSVVLLWDLVWLDSDASHPLPALAAVLGQAVDALSVLSALAFAALLLVQTAGARHAAPPVWVTRWVGLLGLCSLVAVGGGSALLNVVNEQPGEAYASPLVFAVAAITCCVGVWVAVTGHRCVRLSASSR